MSRRLLTYICIDTSGSMKGEPIEAVNVGLQSLLSALRQNPYALESVYLSIFTFDIQIKNVLPLTALENVVLPTISCPESGATFLGKLLEDIAQAVKKDRILATPDQKGDWRPILILLTDGKPSDIQKYREYIPKVKALDFGVIVGCAAGPKAEVSYLQELTPDVVKLDTTDANMLTTFFKWVSSSIEMGGKSQGTGESMTLPPPPRELNLVV